VVLTGGKPTAARSLTTVQWPNAWKIIAYSNAIFAASCAQVSEEAAAAGADALVKASQPMATAFAQECYGRCRCPGKLMVQG